MSEEIWEFLKNGYHLIFYGITFFLSVIRYRRYFDTVLKYLPLIFMYTLLTEMLGNLILFNENFQIVYIDSKYSYFNSLVYNIFDIIFFLYFYYVFYNISTNHKTKRIIQYGAYIFIFASIVNPIFQNFLLTAQIYGIVVGSIVLIICIITYFIDSNVLQNNISFSTSLLPWISIGLLAFYLFYPLMMIIGMFYPNLYEQLEISSLLLFLIAVMHSCFIIGFLKMRRMKPIHEEAI